MPVRTLVIACLDWPVVAAGIEPETPAVVVHANRVIATSHAARVDGVSVGLRRREAQGRSPHLLVLERDQSAESRAFEAVAAVVEEHTPRIEISEPGTCVFPVRGPSRYFGGDEALAQRLSTRVADHLEGRGEVRVGVADGPFAAERAARAARADDPLIVGPNGSPDFLAPLPVSSLGRPELADVLRRLGVATLGALADLPLSDVVGRFGSDGDRAHRLAAGLDKHPPGVTDPPPDLTVAAELDPPAERVDRVALAVRALADELVDRLGHLGLACTRLIIEAESEHGEHHERLWRDEGMLTASAIVDRARWQMDGWLNGPARHRPTAGIARLSLAPDQVVPATGRQLGFWGGETEMAERVARALGQVEGILGAGATAVPEIRGGRGPLDRVGLVSATTVDLAERRVLPADTETSPWPGGVPAPAPAVVPPDFTEIEVVDDRNRPVEVDGRSTLSAPPSRVRTREGWQEVGSWAGPWPAEERWWDPERRRRRARFQVVTTSGDAYLLVLEQQRWWLAATYD